VGPILWYLEALRAACRLRALPKDDTTNENERMQLFYRMLEADRDASLLRFFECFLEAMPQLLVQGFLLAQEFWAMSTSPTAQPIPRWMFVQMASMSFSLLSACATIIVQQRSLRITRPEKRNLSANESILILTWRLSTLLSRYICLVLFILAFKEWSLLVFLCHFLVSFLHVISLQSISTDTSLAAMEVSLLLVNAAIHTFLPFNMAEGSTKRQYAVAYSVEFTENLVLLSLCQINSSFNFPYKELLAVFSVTSFAFGILVMISYYSFFHKSRQLASRVRKSDDDADHVESLQLKPIADETNV
jgi:hypothetical protein